MLALPCSSTDILLNSHLEKVGESDLHCIVHAEVEVERRGADYPLDKAVDGGDTELGVVVQNAVQQCFGILMQENEALLFRQSVTSPKHFPTKILEVVLAEVRNRFRKSEFMEPFYHPFLHFRAGVVGECDGQNLLVAAARRTYVPMPVRQPQKRGQVSPETAGEVVEDQIVGLTRASGSGIDSEHRMVESLGFKV